MAGDFQHSATHVIVGAANGLHHFPQRNVETGQAIRIHVDLVFLFKAAHGGHFGHPFHGGEPVAQLEILQGAQVGQVMLAALVHQGVLEHPAHPGGIRPQCGADPFRQLLAGGVQVFQHPRAGPVDIGVVLEDHIDKAQPHETLATHKADIGDTQQGGGERIGNLVFHQIRAASVPLGEHDHLGIGQIGNGIQRHLQQAAPTPDGGQQHQYQSDARLVRAQCNQAGNHSRR